MKQKRYLFIPILFCLFMLLPLVQAAALELYTRPFSTDLPIPGLLEDENPETADVEMTLTPGTGKVQFFKGVMTPTMGYNGMFLGPTIRVNRGEKVKMKVPNTLSEVTTVHWHGLHVPGEMDGGPHQTIEPGETWEPEFTIDQPAATLWYHPHAIGKTGEQVYRGLAGLFIIEDEVSRSLELPSRYGVDDIPIILSDRRFFDDGSFAYIQAMPDVMHGVIGNMMLVNGAVQPVLKPEASLIRFRILNGSNASLYRISFQNHPFTVIASDGGFLEKPVPMERLVLSPGERGEILLDLSSISPGTEVYLKVEEYNGNEFQAMKIISPGPAGSSGVSVPETLTSVSRIPHEEAVKVRKFTLETGMMGMFSINGKRMDMDRIDETIILGTTEVWEITNRGTGMMNLPHSFHVHEGQFQVLTRDGGAPPVHERGWKDTVLVWPGETVRIIKRFEDYTGLYMYHCHILEHEDAGMMGQFEVSVRRN